ncbi:MAG TPA: glycosyltransferase family 4 protein [Dehalococcoidia bacterium]|nr:glycosyltransferase family 4 protein [Dehalococcoidia bacterium]
MKIALVSPYDLAVPGGVNTHITRLAQNFQALGHETRIIGPSSDELAPAPPCTIVIGKPRSIPASGSVARIALNLRLSGRVKDVLAEERFDVVHVHEPLMPVLPIQFLRHSECVNVGTFHAAKEGGNRLYSYTRTLLKRYYRRLDGKIAVSPAAEQLVSRYFAGYFNIIPNGIDLAPFSGEPNPFPELRDGMRNIVYVGRLEKRKGVAYLLRAFPMIKREMPNTRLIIVGDGRPREGYQRYVRKHEIEDVIFTGYVSDADIPRYYHTADVCCFPATGNESQGYVLLEAMATGKPLVASNIEGFASVVTDEVEGRLVRPRDPEALALALVHLLADERSRRAMGERARLSAQQYSWDRIAHKVLSYYERLLYERGLHPGRSCPPSQPRH